MIRSRLALAALILSACRPGGGFRHEPADAPVIRVSTPSTVSDMSVRETWGYYEAQVASFVYEGLCRAEDADVVPALARAWTTSADGRTYRFTIRSGITFHDGTPFTARDVARAWRDVLRQGPTEFSHPWMLDPIEGAMAFSRGDADTITGVRVLDDTTLTVRLEEPLAFFTRLLALPQAAVGAVASAAGHPIGTGPWHWVSGGGPGSEIRFARFEGYWGTPPALDSLVYRFVPNVQSGRAFEAGWVDLVTELSAEMRVEWGARSDIGFVQSGPMSITRLSINMLEPVFQDVRVRRALNHAVDAARLATAVGAPSATPGTGSIPPGLPGYVADRERYRYDPELATRLLREGGYPRDRPLRLWVPTPGLADFPAEVGPLLRDYFEGAGLTVELTVAREGLEQAMANRDADLALSVWVGDYLDGDAYLYPLYHSNAAGSAANEGWYRNPSVDRLIERSRHEGEPARRASLLRAADSLVFDDAPVVFLWFTRTAVAYSLRLAGWSDDPTTSRFIQLRLAGGDDR